MRLRWHACSMIHRIAPPAKSVAEKIETALAHHEMLLPAQQEQSSNCQADADQSLPGWRFVKEQNPGNSHECRTTSQNCGDRRERAALLKEKEECDRPSAHADTGKHGIEDSLRAGLLIPTARQPKKGEIK